MHNYRLNNSQRNAKFDDVKDAVPGSLESALADEGRENQKLVQAGGYATLSQWLTDQKRDVLDGLRDAPESLGVAGKRAVAKQSADEMGLSVTTKEAIRWAGDASSFTDPLEFSLSCEGLGQKEVLMAGGHASLREWVDQQKFDIASGHRDTPKQVTGAI